MAQFTDSELQCLVDVLDQDPVIEKAFDHTLRSLMDEPVTTTTRVETCKGAVKMIKDAELKREAALARMQRNRLAAKARKLAKGKGGNKDKGKGKGNSDRSRSRSAKSSGSSESSDSS